MTIKQFNASYLLNEDRILFRFNTHDDAEYRLWFTRRVTLFILAATSHLLTKKLDKFHNTDAAKAISEFEKQAIQDSSADQIKDANTFIAGSKFPIGVDGLLVMDVTCSLANNGDQLAYIQHDINGDNQLDEAMFINFILPGGGNLNLKLSLNLLNGVCALLDKLRQNAGWSEINFQEKISEQSKPSSNLMSNSNDSIH